MYLSRICIHISTMLFCAFLYRICRNEFKEKMTNKKDYFKVISSSNKR